VSGARITQEWLDAFARNGMHPTNVRAVSLPTEAPEADEPKKPKLLPDLFIPPATWVIGTQVKSEANARGHWSVHHGRKAGQQRAVSRVLGRHLRVLAGYSDALHEGKPVKVMLTKLGGRKVDKSNLARAFKGVEDACSLILGADDGAANWLVDWGWEANPLVGVRLELSQVNE
jgi:hypothetical protein